ncbi:caspase domain-containing protein [Streptomyces sp. NPDC056255]|uniref:caspase family protein n=1 Tax=Streptomyces sp. NPDC056255 TaxID=3345764 RepID=UPI0035DB0A45
MRVPDPNSSRAVLIGVAEYTELPSLPSVTASVTDLAGLIRAADIWGLDHEQCTVLLNPSSPETVLDALHEAAAAATDTLFVYFAGHGLVAPGGDLYLALPGAHAGQLYRAVAYEALRHQVIDTCVALRKAVVLDCCYSGRALLGHMGGATDMADQAAIEGTYVMTASAETKLAWSPPGERHTAFTGEIIKALSDGIPNSPDPIPMETLYEHVHRELATKARPLPQQRARNAGHRITLAHNRWAGAPIEVPAESSAGTTVDDSSPGRSPMKEGKKRSRFLPVLGAVAVLSASVFAYWLGIHDSDGGTQKKNNSDSNTHTSRKTGASTGDGENNLPTAPDASLSPDPNDEKESSAPSSPTRTVLPSVEHDPVSDIADQAVNTAAIMRLAPCSDRNFKLQARSQQLTYDLQEPVRITIDLIRDASAASCRVNVSREKLTIGVIRAGSDSDEWSSVFCVGSHAEDRWLSLERSATVRFTWDGDALSATTCAPGASSPDGTYLAEAAMGTNRARTSFTRAAD